MAENISQPQPLVFQRLEENGQTVPKNNASQCGLFPLFFAPLISTAKKMKNEKASATIRRLREAAGLTQQEAGDRIGYSRSAIQKFELGRRTPPARIMPLIIKGLTP